jgi:dTDP-glucose 4,6-dehydratase
LVNRICEKHHITHIINFAAESHVDRSISNPDVFIETNIKGTLSLLNAAKKNDVQRFIQISTDEVYGSLTFNEPPFCETTPISPRSPYAASKASADLLALSFFHTYGFPVSITRCSNNYGPHQFPEKLIPLMIRNIRLGQKLPVYGDGKNVRDWIHVKDHCEGILAVINKGMPGEVYNFGGNAEKANIDLVHLLLKELNASESLITYVKDRPGHDLRYAMNFDKVKRDLGWSPKIAFEDGLKQTVQWYLDNSAWVDNITSGQYLEYYKQHYGNI